MKSKGIIFTIASALLFGITPAIASYSYTLGSNAETLTFYRNLLVLPVTLLIMIFRKTSFVIDFRQFVNILIIGLLGKGITTLAVYASYSYIGISVATTIHFLYPIFVALLCFFLYKEKLSKEKIIALMMASAGIFLFLENNGSGSTTGILLAVLSAVTYAFFMVGVDKSGLKNMDPIKLSFYISIVVAVGMFFYDLVADKIIYNLSLEAFAATFVVAICTSLFAVVFLQLGIRHLSATLAAIFSLFEPVTSTIMGAVLFNEVLTTRKILGTIVVLGAVAYLSFGDKLKKKAAK